MDNKGCNKDKSFQTDEDFLLDENFIRWRLFQTEELNRYWKNILTENPHLEKVLHEAITQFNAVKINRNQLSEGDRKNVYKAVQRNIYRYKRLRLLRRVGAVAAVLVIAVLSILFITYEKNFHSQDVIGEIIVGEALPEEEIYLISGGERISIAHQSHIGLTEGGKALVTDSTDTPKELLLAVSTELNKLIVPHGKRTNLTLPDGTEIWLNSGTQLDFPSEFTGSRREIRVNGEIFINVAHNAEKPFIILAQDMSIQVLGTSFNVSAYHDDSRKYIVLVEGRVSVEPLGREIAELLPNEKLEIIDSDITKETVNVSEYISWTRGILEFDETPVSEILKKVGRYYNVQFESSPEITLNDKTCSGKLFLSNNLDSVMASVSVLSSTVYRREDNIIHITKK